MRSGSWVVVVGLSLCACQPGGRFEEPTRPVARLPLAPFRTSSSPPALSHPDGATSLWPFELVAPMDFAATAQPGELVLPMPRSARGVWATVSTPTPVTLVTLHGETPLRDRAFFFLPARDGVIPLRIVETKSVLLSVAPVALVDTMGGGFVVADEATEKRSGITEALFTPPDEPLADDTMGVLATLTAEAAAQATVRVGRCKTAKEPDENAVQLEVPAAGSVTQTHWLPPASWCMTSTAPVTLSVTRRARARRFATTALEPLSPVTLLDTAKGTGWAGLPGAEHELELTLPSPPATTALLLKASAEAGDVWLETCGATTRTPRPPGLWLFAPGTKVCVRASGEHHVSLSVIGLVAPRSEKPPLCAAARPPFVCDAPQSDLVAQLRCVPGVVSVTPHVGMNRRPGVEQFDVRFEQPSDHFRPERGLFQQRLIVSVRSLSAPTVLHTPGYELADYSSDVAATFPTNELEVEHRFFGESMPSPADLSTLTIMQSAADSHRIVEAFAPLFTGPWVNTGHSKGGMTALFHRRFFPCDVTGSAPYVTPISLGRDDARYAPHLETLGGPTWAACREAFFTVDRELITNATAQAAQLRGTYSRIGGPENALWATTGAGYWGIFQYGLMTDPQYGCAVRIAQVQSRLADVVARQAFYATGFADEATRPTSGKDFSYPFQTLNELGAPGTTRAHLAQLGPAPQLPPKIEFDIALQTTPKFEPRAMPDVLSWVARHGSALQFIYGEWDPWTGGAVATPGVMDAAKYIGPEAAHDVSVTALAEPDRTTALNRLERWLGVRPLSGGGMLVRERPRTYGDVMRDHEL